MSLLQLPPDATQSPPLLLPLPEPPLLLELPPFELLLFEPPPELLELLEVPPA